LAHGIISLGVKLLVAPAQRDVAIVLTEISALFTKRLPVRHAVTLAVTSIVVVIGREKKYVDPHIRNRPFKVVGVQYPAELKCTEYGKHNSGHSRCIDVRGLQPLAFAPNIHTFAVFFSNVRSRHHLRADFMQTTSFTIQALREKLVDGLRGAF
jgi:hypothetical protein